MKNIFLISLTILFMITSCGKKTENPFFSEYDTPFGVPPFDEIENKHFEPAFLKGMEKQNEEIQAIIDNADEPTFANTIEAFEYSGYLLGKVSFVFYNFNSCLIDDEITEIAKDMATKMSAHSDNIWLNIDLFEKVQAVYNQKDELDLEQEEMRLLAETYRKFVRSGALLPEEKREKLKEINSRLSSLTLQFGQNVLGDINSYRMVIDNEEDLSGLPQSAIDNAAERAANEDLEGKWVFTMQNPSVMPFMYNADNRELRKEIQQAYISRGNNDNEFNNKKIIGEIINLRIERSNLLGYETYADATLEDRMAGDVETVMNFLEQVWEPALNIAKQEAYDLQQMIYSEGNDFRLEQWDWRYYTEKIRQEKYEIDEQIIRQYFELNTVRDGIFDITNKLWGLTYEERDDVPKYHEDVQVFEVMESDGTHIGILYMDFHPRDSKRPGAWMSAYRTQSVDREGEFVNPVITIVCNFSPPSGGQPALLTYDEMTTFFHEFGHALHGLLSNVKYPSLAGTNVPRDFVELPSQVMENWAKEPKIMQTFALHYETKEQMPQDLMDRIVALGHFNTGFSNVEFIASAWLDMEYHILTEPFDESEWEKVASIIDKRTIEKYGIIPEINFRHGSPHFNHIFSLGYSAGYYSYLWSGLLDADVYEAFVETGDLFDQETAKRLREKILERGGTKDAMKMYIDFRGREPIVDPLLRQRGLN